MAAKSNTLTLYNRSVNDLLYDVALSSSYQTAWVYDPDLALRNDADIWEKVRSDSAFMSSIDRSTRSIVKPWRVERSKVDKSKQGHQLAAICNEGLSDIYRFNASRRRLAESRYLARTYAYIESEIRAVALDGTPEMDWVIPRRLVDIDRRRFRWIPERGRLPEGRPTLSTKLGFFNTVSQQWEDVSQPFRDALIEYTVQDTEDRVGYGRGLLVPIYFAHYMKTTTIDKMAKWIDRWSSPMLIGKLDSLRNASVSKTNEDLRKGMMTMLQIFRDQNVGVLQDGDEITPVEVSGTGYQMSADFVHYWDDCVERLCNGSTRPSGMGGQKSGARAQAETEEDTSEAFFQDEREDLDAILDNYLLGFFLKFNMGNLQKLGMVPGVDCKRPRFASDQIKRENPLEAVQVAQGLKTLGFTLSKSEISEKTGWKIPEDDEETIEGQTPEMEAALGGLKIGGDGKPKPFETLGAAEKGNSKKD